MEALVSTAEKKTDSSNIFIALAMPPRGDTALHHKAQHVL